MASTPYIVTRGVVLRETETKECLHNKRYAAFSGLAVDTNHRLVLAADIGRIDRKIRNLPDLALTLQKRVHTFVDRILMGAGKCCKYKFSCVRMARVDVHFGCTLINFKYDR